MASGIENATGVQFGSDATLNPYAYNLMTNFFLPILADARNNSSVLWSMLKKKAPEQISGRFMVWPTRVGRNRGRNAIRPEGQLPDPGQQGSKTCIAETRTYMGRIKISGEVVRRGVTNGGAFVEPIMFETEGQVEDLMIDMNRMAHNDGTGRLAEVNTAAATLVLRINQGIEGASTCTTAPTLHLEVGDRVAFYIPATDLLRINAGGQSGFYVSAITTTTITLTSDAALASAFDPSAASGTFPVVQGDWVVRASTETPTGTAVNATASRAEMMGFEGLFSDAGVPDGTGAAGAQQTGANVYTGATSTTFQGQAATSANPWNQAVVSDNGTSGARPLTESLLQQAISDAEERNNANVQFLLCPYNTYNSYVDLLTPDKRYTNTTELTGGHKTLTFNGIPLIKDRYCYGNRIKGVDPDEITYYEVQPLAPLDPMGVGRWERIPNFDAYYTGYVFSGNLVANIRQRLGFNLVDLSR